MRDPHRRETQGRVRVIETEIPEGIVPPSTSMATPKRTRPEPTDRYVALLRQASTHLRTQCHVGRHDHWGAGYTCAACRLAQEIDAALDPLEGT